MKKLTLIMSALFVGAALFSSCNKKLKEDLKELDSQVDELKAKNEELQNKNNDLQNQTNDIASAIGSNEPITATTTFVDDNGNTRTWTDTYKFKAGNYSTQFIEDNGNGTYDIYIERFSDVEWYEGVYIEFTYNPTTQAITNKEARHYWDWNLPYASQAGYYPNSGYAGVCAVTINLTNINIATGDISLSVTATGDDAYASDSGNLANNDKGATTTFSFTGKLKVYPEN